MSSSRKAFTLVEMLIVIVIIGILAVALIPRLMGIQSRARDTARTADMRQISDAIVLYGVDNGGNYPPAFVSQLPITQSPWHTFSVSNEVIFSPSRTLVQTNTALNLDTQGTIAALGDNLRTYISLLPNDPSNQGIRAQSNTPDCVTEDPNNTYGYFRDINDTMYAITMVSEAGRGNSTNCGGRIDSRNGDYKTVGQGLVYEAGYYSNDSGEGDSDYPPESEWTDMSCFTVSNGDITAYDTNCGTDVIIPHGITSIGKDIIPANYNAAPFIQKGITSVEIPSSVTEIGYAAFYGNNIGTLNMANGIMTIGTAAFQNNSIDNIIIPNSVQTIGNTAFNNNQATSLVLGTGITSIGQHAFGTNLFSGSIFFPGNITSSSIGGDLFAITDATAIIEDPDLCAGAKVSSPYIGIHGSKITCSP